MSVSERLARLLFIVPQAVQSGGIPVATLAKRLHVDEKQVENDVRLLCMVGRPPLTPDHLLDVYVDDGIVRVHLNQRLVRPLRLTAQEACALVLAAKLVENMGDAANASDDDDDDVEDKKRSISPTSAVITRVLSMLPPKEQERVRALDQGIAIGRIGGPRHVHRCLQEAMLAHKVVLAHYFSASSHAQKRYILHPLAWVGHGGHDYLIALDEEAGGQEKLFRLDRFDDTEILDRSFAPVAVDLERFRRGSVYCDDTGSMAAMRFWGSSKQRMDEQFDDADKTQHSDGSLEIRLRTSSMGWLARWVMQHADEGVLLSPKEGREHIVGICVEAAKAYAEDPIV